MHTMIEVASLFPTDKRMFSIRNERNVEVATAHVHKRPFASWRVIGNGGTINEYKTKAAMCSAWGIR